MSFVAISKVKYPAELKEAIHAVGINMIPIAKRQPGFVSIAFHQSTEKNETMMYWQWQSEQDHLACMQADDWQAIIELSKSLFQSEGVELSIESYERLV
jgi:quinol monooxygenase YgiN